MVTSRHFLQTNLHACVVIPKWIAVSQFQFQKIKRHKFFCIVLNFGEIQSSLPEFTLLKKTTFATIWQKLAYHSKYLGISWTDHYCLYRFGRHMGGMIIPIFVWRSPKARCYGKQLNLGAACRCHRNDHYCLLWHSTTDTTILTALSKD